MAKIVFIVLIPGEQIRMVLDETRADHGAPIVSDQGQLRFGVALVSGIIW